MAHGTFLPTSFSPMLGRLQYLSSLIRQIYCAVLWTHSIRTLDIALRGEDLVWNANADLIAGCPGAQWWIIWNYLVGSGAIALCDSSLQGLRLPHRGNKRLPVRPRLPLGSPAITPQALLEAPKALETYQTRTSTTGGKHAVHFLCLFLRACQHVM